MVLNVLLLTSACKIALRVWLFGPSFCILAGGYQSLTFALPQRQQLQPFEGAASSG